MSFFWGGGALRATFLKQDLSQVEFYSHLIGCLNMNIFQQTEKVKLKVSQPGFGIHFSVIHL